MRKRGDEEVREFAEGAGCPGVDLEVWRELEGISEFFDSVSSLSSAHILLQLGFCLKQDEAQG